MGALQNIIEIDSGIYTVELHFHFLQKNHFKDLCFCGMTGIQDNECFRWVFQRCNQCNCLHTDSYFENYIFGSQEKLNVTCLSIMTVISFLKNVTQWACDSIDCGKYLCTLARWIVTAKKALHSVHWVLKQSKTKKMNKIKRICSDILNTTLCWKKLQKDGMGATRCKAAWSWPKKLLCSCMHMNSTGCKPNFLEPNYCKEIVKKIWIFFTLPMTSWALSSYRGEGEFLAHDIAKKLEGVSATGVDQSTESTEKAQAGSSSLITQNPGLMMVSHTPEFSSLVLCCTPHRQNTFSIVGHGRLQTSRASLPQL